MQSIGGLLGGGLGVSAAGACGASAGGPVGRGRGDGALFVHAGPRVGERGRGGDR